MEQKHVCITYKDQKVMTQITDTLHFEKVICQILSKQKM